MRGKEARLALRLVRCRLADAADLQGEKARRRTSQPGAGARGATRSLGFNHIFTFARASYLPHYFE
jgi:hypothetical protein